MTFQPYNIVPGTQIIHSITDCYEFSDEVEGCTHTVKLQVDNGGVYLESTGKQHDSQHRGITEYMSIANKELAIVVAKRILELYGVN
jgi:folate-dependent phosphoribosylglycinamide formyltransferase PurN